jgi:hypothetical protein
MGGKRDSTGHAKQFKPTEVREQLLLSAKESEFTREMIMTDPLEAFRIWKGNRGLV